MDTEPADDSRPESTRGDRLLFEKNPVPMWIFDVETLRFLDVNEAAVRHYGWSREEFLAMSIRDIRPPDEIARLEAYLANHPPGSEKAGIWRHLKKDGTTIEVSVTSLALVFAGRDARLVISQDVTESRRAELALRESEERFRLMADSAPVMLWMTDSDGRPAFYNAAARAFTGVGPESGRSWLDGVHPDDVERYRATYLSDLGGRRPLEMEYRLRRAADGEYRWICDTGVPRFTPAGAFIGYIGSSVDITDRKLREREHEALLRVSAALRRCSSSADMVPVVLEELRDLFAAESSAFVVREGDELVVAVGCGGWVGMAERRQSEAGTITGEVLRSGEPSVENDVSANPRLSVHSCLAGLTAVACAPLVTETQSLGAMWIGCRQPIPSHDVRLLASIAEMTANAVRRAGLHQQTERRLRQLTALRAGQLAISGSLDLSVTLNALLEQITSVLDFDAAGVLLLDSRTGLLAYAAGRGFRSPIFRHPPIALGQDKDEAGLAARHGLDRHVPDLRAVAGDLIRPWLLDEEGFVTYHAIPLVTKGNVKGVLELFHRSPQTTTAEWMDFVRTLALQATVAIENASLFDEARRSNLELRLAYDTTLEGWSRALDLRDKETEGHTRRVTELTVRLARVMGVPDDEIVHLRRGALLHDIGKMAIPDAILLKPGPLTAQEWEIMRLHPVYAHQFLSAIPFLRPALDIPHYHHEKWDGTGYPRGLKGEEIPLSARVFAIVDVWDALSSDRPYRSAWPAAKILEHLRALSGVQFDPEVADLFLREIVRGPEAFCTPVDPGAERAAVTSAVTASRGAAAPIEASRPRAVPAGDRGGSSDGEAPDSSGP